MTKDELLVIINDILKQKNWSMNKLAKESGIPPSTIYNIPKRKNMPELQSLLKISNALDVSLECLLGIERRERTDYSVYIDKEFYEICVEFDESERQALKEMAKTIRTLKHHDNEIEE